MPKLRLTETLRDRLIRLAEKLVALPAEEAAVAQTYAVAAPLIRAMIEEKFPVADMLILQKYDKARQDSCIRLNLTAGGIVEFTFDDGDAPLSAGSYCRVHQADKAITAAFDNWSSATDALKSARVAKIADYKSLIRFSRNLEDVAAIWPEAEQVRPVGTSLVALSDDVVARIRADAASRMAEAA